MNPREQWTDERISDLANTVWAHREVPMRMAVLDNRLLAIERDTLECKQGIQKLHEIRSQERKEQQQEAKSNKRWLVTTAIGVLTIVLMAVGVLIQSGGP